MADHSHGSAVWKQPPPAPPLPPTRTGGVFQKFIAPLSFNIGARPHGSQATQSATISPSTVTNRISRNLPSQTTIHRTGIPIAAVDINKSKTHAILAGHDILKTVHVHEGRAVEDFNLRSGISSYSSAYAARSETANHRREYLPAKDVVWSKGDKYDKIVATAALNGRIALYDVSRVNSSRIELAWIHEHTGQVNKLDFDPFVGNYLLSGSQDKTVRIWDIREPQSVKRKHTVNIRQPVRDVRWSPTVAGVFALCTENGVVQRWDIRNMSNALLSINAHEKACYAIDWHPDGRHVVSGGFDKYAKVWDFSSDNRRQKPAFSLRAPQAILQVRWRPPCWSSDLAEKGHWQSAQLATSYAEDDPRIHIWDLRRPLLPFREHDRYNYKPNDIMWATQDYLWSVGTQGMFVQTDIRYTTLVQDEIPISSTDFMPDGSFVSFSEDIRSRRKSSADDPAAGFLRIPQERLSGGTDGAISRSLSDEDDGDDGLLTTSSRGRVSRSSRSTKSRGNTPPTSDAQTNIIPLDRAVLSRNGLFINEQMGMQSSIVGASANPGCIEFLSDHYAQPMTTAERVQSPTQILIRLQNAFARNANACDYVSMHRMAQSWRVLGAVIIPELQDWADANRKRRLEVESHRRVSPVTVRSTKTNKAQPPPSLSLSRSKVMNNLFKGVTGSDRGGSDVESSSNVTTPTAKPISESSVSMQRRPGNNFLPLNHAIEPIPPLPPLPPSVVSSHTTAAAASKALLETTHLDSPPSSPEKPRLPMTSHHKRSITDIPLLSTDRTTLPFQSPKPQPISKQLSSPLVAPSPRMESRKQEDRRAAIRDFRAQQRPLFTFEEPVQSPRYNNNERHGSSDSFPMFSASTDSSARARSLGQSVGSPKDSTNGPRDSEEWQSVGLEDVMESLPSESTESLAKPSYDSTVQYSEDEGMLADFPMDETPQDEPERNIRKPSKWQPEKTKASAAASMWDIGKLGATENLSRSDTAASSVSVGVIPFEETSNIKKLRIYSSNPIRRIVTKAEAARAEHVEIQASHNDADVSCEDYVHNDFRSIDFTDYEPKLPWAWSALPLICHSVAFDVHEGIASAQFSVHLLMHLHPFFFNPGQQIHVQPGIAPPDSIAERLMRPDLSHRIIGGLFLNHYLYLKKMRLYKSMAEIKKICVELGFEEIFNPTESDQPVGASLKQDPFLLQRSCIHCYSFMQAGVHVCQNCGNPQGGCPICLQLNVTQHSDSIQSTGSTSGSCSLWTFCQACGHGSHWECMQGWMLQPDAEGECPTQGCGCDCGPGLIQQQRIARQVTDAETTEMIRGSRSSTAPKKDPARASHSPAVDKTRDALRQSDIAGQTGSSSDERPRRSFSGRGGSRGGISVGGNGVSRGTNSSFGRRVRLVTPGEESVQSYSAS